MSLPPLAPSTHPLPTAPTQTARHIHSPPAGAESQNHASPEPPRRCYSDCAPAPAPRQLDRSIARSSFIDSRRQKKSGRRTYTPAAPYFCPKLSPWLASPSTMLSFGMGLCLRVRIVLIVVDRSADVVLPLIDLLMLLRGQVAAICRAISRNLVIDARLASLDVPGLPRRHLAGPNPLRNALLLILRSHPGTGESRVLRTPAVYRCKVTAIRMRHLHMVLLFDCGINMVLPRKRSFLCTRACLDTTVASIKARAGEVIVNDHRIVHIRVVDHRPVHVDDGCVIRKAVAHPASAAKADAAVAKAVVHATVEADMRPPVSGMEDIHAATPAPITRRPQQPGLWRPNPHTGNPVITLIAIGPVARIPEIAISRANRLCVNRQHWRGNGHRNKDSGKRS